MPFAYSSLTGENNINIEAVDRSSLMRYAWLSLAAAGVTIGLKSLAYFMTGSVGLLSDALESLVNLAGALMALAMLRLAAQPADENHQYGHSKAEYFSSGVEGALILVAAVGIGIAAVQRFFVPKPLEQVGLGLAVSVAASLVNLIVALILLRAGKRFQSVTLTANAQHLLTDVWTSAGVLVGVVAVVLSGWLWLDPVAALLVAGNIIWIGVRIVRQSVLGLMDVALPAEEIAVIQEVLATHAQIGIQYHALRTRQAGARRFVSLHVIVPGEWSVHQGHQLMDRIETDICQSLPNVTALTHLESLDDPASWEDMDLDRRNKD